MDTKKIIILAGIAVLLPIGWFLTHRQGTRSSIDENTLVVGTNPEFPPFEYIEGNELVGFDIDLMNAIAQKLGKKIDWRQMSFDALIPGIQLGQIQLIAAGMTPSAERAQRVLFTKKYLDDTLSLVIPASYADTIKTLDDLKGKTVVVNQGYTADNFISKQSNLEVLRLETPLEAFMALQAGHAVAFVTAERILPPFLEKFKKDAFAIVKLPYVEESAALAISKKYPELLEAIQKALDELEEDGTMQELKKKWKF